MNFKKYIWKCRLLVLNTPNYNNEEYKNSKDIYQKYIKEFLLDVGRGATSPQTGPHSVNIKLKWRILPSSRTAHE